MFCISCKKNIPDDAIYCQYCGKKQSTVARSFRRRGNGLGSVYKMPSGTWAAETTLGWYTVDGQKKRKKAKKYGFKTKKEAVLYLERLSERQDVPKSPTFSELWERLDLSELSAGKQDAYRLAWSKIVDAVGYLHISDATVDDLQAAADVAKTYYTRKDIKMLFSKLYQLALRDDLCDKNRAEFIKLPKLEKSEREIFTEEDIAKLWDDYKKSGQLVTAVMLIMLYTGMRPAEILGAKVENVHLPEHYLIGGVKTEKGRNRKIIIPDKIVPIISALISTAKKGKLCHFSHKTDFYDKWAEKRAALGLRPELAPYCCRHTYITNCTRLGLSPAMLQELVGHEDYDTTLDYTHLSVADRLEAVNRL